MPPLPSAKDLRDPRWWRRNSPRLLLAAMALLVILWLGGLAAGAVAARRLRAAAAAHGYGISWQRLHASLLGSVSLSGLRASRASTGEAVLAADRVEVGLNPLAALIGRARPDRVRIGDGRLLQPSPAPEDTLAELESAVPPETGPSPEPPPLARSLTSGLHLLTRDFTRLPRVELTNVSLVPRGAGIDSLVIESSIFDPRGGSSLLSARGEWFSPEEVPFTASCVRLPREEGVVLSLRSDPDVFGDEAPFALREASAHLMPIGHTGRWHCMAQIDSLVIRDPSLSTLQVAALRLRAEDDLAIQRHPARIALGDSTRITIGRIPLRVGFELDERGPVAGFSLRADGLTGDLLKRELPRAVLGPLRDVTVKGTFDYRLDCRVDFSHLDQAVLHGDVTPHALWLDDANSPLSLSGLNEPFLAQIHLTGGHVEERFVGPANPYFTPYAALPPHLVYAVLANEDGGFFQHRGFSVDAMRQALALNLRRGRFVRGAGTITMQLVRNLWLGRERSLARKGQEVILTWLLENLAQVPKERLLEIYMNIIEWAPGVHGAGEAARYFFDKDARQLTLDEALFLTVVVPSPRLWRYRFERGSAELRRGTRQQMLFIARAMARKGWLAPERIPAAPESLHVELRGQARTVLLPPPADSSGARPS